ncbi:hypothetical protein CISG_05757 [Coccidioides immitis RMSCC 3703]|uniref:Uncharacterized protein n=2 Tax=Coccidioides immitis TaxID=5501 RepID=A0A0J8QUS4_COCIT|nr:hypothetical protein CIRG_05634 [Coccidioides immitis RMSCC 2394]KMU76614.1 hypothetical protein CISG_05757 [Coccidioides immitis RMSCC 3703]
MGDFSRAQSSPGYFFTDSNGMPKTSSKSCPVNLSYDCSWALAQRPPPWRFGLLLMHAYPVTKTLRLSHTVKKHSAHPGSYMLRTGNELESIALGQPRLQA